MAFAYYQTFDEDELYEEFISVIESMSIPYKTFRIPIYTSVNPPAIQSEQISFEAMPEDFKNINDILEPLISNYQNYLMELYNIDNTAEEALHENLVNSYETDKILFFLSKLKLKQKGTEVTNRMEEQAVEQIINESREPKEVSQNTVILMYVLGAASILAFFALGIALGLLPSIYIANKGYEFAYSKKENADGTFTYKYNEKSRFNGKSFLGMGIVLVGIWIIGMYLRLQTQTE